MMASPNVDPRNLNTLWCSVALETLVRCGVRQAVVSPGSRSGPLAVAAARQAGLEAIPVLDERSAAFFALGLARQQLRPVVLICTSGTAGANYFPAIIEARESGVPLLVITADRPPELRACAAGQTIDQQKLYGDFVQFYHELALPEMTEAALRYLRQTLAHACARTSTPYGGPVHINAPFRDPLAPLANPAVERFAQDIDWNHFFAHLAPAGAVEPVGRAPALSADVHGAIILGPAQPRDPESFVATVGEIARKLGWPVLADGLNPARNYASRIPHLVTTYDAILRAGGIADRLKPEVVLCLGGWPTSKVLRGWLETSGAPVWLLSTRPDNRDPLHGNTRQLGISLRTLAAGLPEGSGYNGYEEMWRSYEDTARRMFDQRLDAESRMFEPKAAWLLARHLAVGTPLFIASSMPVRDVEYVWPPGDRQIRPFFNRGANGIDGTLSTALGVAHGGPPAVLLTGDLALLHDSNGFLIRPKFRGSLTIVLINNQGGGIFNHLPVADYGGPFEEFFATPQAADFASLAAAHGAEHIMIHDWSQYIGLITALPAAGIRVLEVQTDRQQDAAARKQLFADIAAGPANSGGPTD